MRKILSFATLVLAILSIAAPTAWGATEFGDSCTGNAPVPVPYTLTTLSAPGSVPLTAPVSGVITKVKMRVGLSLPGNLRIPEQVKLLKSAGGNNYTVTNQTTIGVGTGLNEADARIPVRAGERLAVRGLPFTYEGSPFEGYEFYCGSGSVEGVLGIVPSDVPPGSTAEFMAATEGRVPLSAVIEPDADGDGFGDETQDACPQSATTQVACPLVVLSTSTQIKKGAVVVIVTTTTPAPVSVKGVVKLGKGKKAALSGGTQNLTPGVLGKFTLKFTKKLKTKLAELSRKQSLTLQAAVTGTNVAGQVTTKTLKIKLRGRA
jgi:hypothetical protein